MPKDPVRAVAAVAPAAAVVVAVAVPAEAEAAAEAAALGPVPAVRASARPAVTRCPTSKASPALRKGVPNAEPQ